MKLKKLLLFSSILYSFSSLAVDCSTINCIGKIAIDGGNEVGKITKVEDGTIHLVQGTWNYTRAQSQIALEQESSEYPKGHFTIDQGNEVGQVVRYFENGKLQLKQGTWIYYRTTSQAKPEVTNISEFKKDVATIDNGNEVGLIVRVFSNGKAQLKQGSWVYYRNISDLGYSVPSYEDIKVDQAAIDTGSEVGSVVRAFSNGKFQLKQGSWVYYRKYNQISPEVAELDGYKKGIIAIDNKNEIGSVVRVFKNSKLQMKQGSWVYYRDINNSKLEIAELGNLKKGGYAIASDLEVGQVKHIFEDGRVSLQQGSWNFIRKNPFAEIDTHPTYSKEDHLISDNELINGTPLRFFENGALQIKGLYSTTATMNAYKEVDQLDFIAKDQLVIDYGNRSGVVTRLYENGAFEYKTIEDEQETFRTARVYRQDESRLLEESKKYLEVILPDQTFTGQMLLVNPYNALAVKAENYKSNLEFLKNILEENNNLIENDKLRNNILKELNRLLNLDDVVVDDSVTQNDQSTDNNDVVVGDNTSVPTFYDLEYTIDNDLYDASIVSALKDLGLNGKKVEAHSDSSKVKLAVSVVEKKKGLIRKCHVAIHYVKDISTANSIGHMAAHSVENKFKLSFKKQGCAKLLRKRIKQNISQFQ